MHRLPATCVAIRRARIAALDIAIEADIDGRPGIARALRRKVQSPRRGDWIIDHSAREVVVTIAAHGVRATASCVAHASGSRHAWLPAPSDHEAAEIARAARAIAKREQVTA